MFNFATIALLFLPPLLIAVVLIRRKPGAPPFTLVVSRFVAIAYAALTLVFTVITVVTTLVSDAVDVTIPVGTFWPEPHPGVTIDQGPTASVISGGFASADVTVSGLGTDARLLLAGGHTLQGLTFTVIAIVVALLCHRLLNGMAFRPVLSRSINVAAATIAAGGILWQVCFWIGGSIASTQVLTVTGWQSHESQADDLGALTPDFDPFATGLPDPTFALSVEFWPLFLGLALAAVAAAFRYGERLQRDTEGLV